jgi:hypothetical protein
VGTQKEAVEMNVKEFLLGLTAATMSPSLKKTFYPKVIECMMTGKRLTLASVDLEAYAPGDMKRKPDKNLLVIGIQRLMFENGRFTAKSPKQFVLGLDGRTALDLIKLGYEYLKDADGIIGHFVEWDVTGLKDYGIRANLGARLPEAAIDIMTPFKGRSGTGVSLAQEHLGIHFGFGTEKGRVSEELWRRATLGENEGLSRNEVLRLRRRIRDERNRSCLEFNLHQIDFLSQHIRKLNRLTVFDLYPNDSKMDEGKPLSKEEIAKFVSSKTVEGVVYTPDLNAVFDGFKPSSSTVKPIVIVADRMSVFDIFRHKGVKKRN